MLNSSAGFWYRSAYWAQDLLYLATELYLLLFSAFYINRVRGLPPEQDQGKYISIQVKSWRWVHNLRNSWTP